MIDWGCTRRYSALLGATRRYSALLGATRRYSALLGATRRYSALLGATRRYSALPGATRRYPALPGATRRSHYAVALSRRSVSLLDGLRSARRGSAAGPSGATHEHLRILLDDEEDARLLYGAASRLANATVPPVVLEGLRVGRLVALRKPNGRVRALVVGDVLRRLVGRVLAQHFAPHLQAACMPYQYGLSTRVGTEAVSRLLRAATEASPRATVLSVDAVGAFDHVSRGSMLDALHGHPELQPLLPFARQFYRGPADARPLRSGPTRSPQRPAKPAPRRGSCFRFPRRCLRRRLTRTHPRTLRPSRGSALEPCASSLARGQNAYLECRWRRAAEHQRPRRW